MTKDRVLSGMRPTGNLHLGNYLGALANWVRMQDDYECFYFSADWHVLTDHAEDRGDIPAQTIEMFADWLGAGLDPERCTLFAQSLVPEHAELHLLFSMVTPVTWLERVPTYKERIEQQEIASPSYGLLGYPLLQSADILMYKAKCKMSKSYGNAIYLSDAAEDVVKKVKIFTLPAEREACATGCRTAGIGCLDCKDVLLRHMLPALAPIRDRRQSFAEKPDRIVDVIHEGSRRARVEAQRTIDEVRSKVRLAP